MDAADEYEAYLATNGHSENDLHRFLEQHTELLPVTPFELGHGVRLDSFITKFPLDSTLITDFVFLTKNTGTWRITLIEIEPTDVPLFTGSIDAPQPTADFTKRLTQIELWKLFVKDHSAIIVNHLKPLMKAVPRHPDDYDLEFKYILIVGRRSGLTNDKALKLFRAKSDDDTEVIVHDSLISRFKERPTKRGNILRMEGTHFTYKYLTCPSIYAFDTVTANDLKLADRHVRHLERHGFEITKWKEGARLNALGKAPVGPHDFGGVRTTDIAALHQQFRDDLEDV